jgi:4-hydroxy-tetrahydrodipicolinate synthase
MRLSISGVYAALATPIDATGRPDLDVFDQLINFVLERGVDGVVIGGGTGEYPHFDLDQRETLAKRAVEQVAGRALVITCVGASSIFAALKLARSAADSGSDFLLLPAPHFFRYSQDDLATYIRAVCSAVPSPFLLYNLPAFAGPIKAQTAIRLIRTIPNLVGIKDSSGERRNIELLAKVSEEPGCSVFVGDDSLLLDALQAGWSGAVSGIGCFVPELIVAVYRAHQAGETERASALQAMLNDLIHEVVKLPIPWSVRVGLEARGISCGPMHLPPSRLRLRQMDHLRAWLESWAAERNLNLRNAWKSIPAQTGLAAYGGDR